MTRNYASVTIDVISKLTPAELADIIDSALRTTLDLDYSGDLVVTVNEHSGECKCND